MTTQTIFRPITRIPMRVEWAHLHDSPTQPRTSYDEEYLDELAESIKANGDILSPMMIRKRMADPAMPLDQWELERDGYENIFGHCRKRAGMRAGLPDGPAELVEMTDAQVRLAQLAENLNREDLTFLEEAETLAKLKADGVDHDELKRITGKKRTYVYNQLKLATASPAVKEACKSGKLNQELATIISRIPPHKLQDSALKIALDHSRVNDGVGYRKTRKDLLEKYSTNLKQALWALDDALLVPSAGACTTCPNRSGCTPELFGDLLTSKGDDYYSHYAPHGQDICMDPECFALKKKTQLNLDAAELASQGKTVITGNAAKQALTAGGEVKGEKFVAVKDVKALLKNVKGAERPQQVVIQDQKTGKAVVAVKRSDLTAAGIEVPDAATRQADNSAKHAAERKKWDDKAKLENEFRLELLDQVRAVMISKPRSSLELREVAKHILGGVYGQAEAILLRLHEVKSKQELTRKIDTMTPDQLGILMVDRLLVAEMYVQGYELQNGYGAAKPGNLHMLANHHGVNVKAARAKWEKAKGIEAPDAKPKAKSAAKSPAAQPTPTPAATAGTPAQATTTPDNARPALKPGAVRYRNPATGETWSGRGLQPKWVAAALASGKKLEDFETGRIKTGDDDAPDDAGLAEADEAARA